jgi:EpsI family protein
VKNRDNWMRFLAVMALLLVTSLLLRGQSDDRARLPERQEFSRFPMRIGDWEGRPAGIPADVREVLGDGDFLERVYQQPGETPVDLFLAYFPSQRAGNTMHSPQNCLPGSGWTPISQALAQVALPHSEPVTVNRYVVARGVERELVLYWYLIHGRVVADEYRAKFFLVSDAIRLNRKDGALSRIITPVTPHETIEGAERRAVRFGQEISPLLEAYIPR